MASQLAFHGTVPSNYDKYLGPFLFEPYATHLVEMLSGKQYSSILEIACGTGRVTKHLLTLLSDGGTITATDLNAEMIAVAKENVSDDRIRWQVVDAQKLPFNNESFDLVVCQFGVMFFPDKKKAFEETYRVLKPNGLFIFSAWDSLQHNLHTGILNDVLKEQFGSEAPAFWEEGPFSFNDRDAINNMMRNASFKNVQIAVVSLISGYASIDDLLTGLLEGTPLASFLAEKSAAEVEELRTTCRKKYIEVYGEKSSNVPMQALICTGEKR